MIKLTLNPNSQAITRIFQKDSVIVGSNSLRADLVLSDEILEEAHVRIDFAGDRYTIYNIANDPFVTLNGLPFGKKWLKNHDLIQIGSTSILFEEYSQESENNNLADTRQKLPDILDRNINPSSTPITFSEVKISPYATPSSKHPPASDDKNIDPHFHEELKRSNELSLFDYTKVFKEDEIVDYDVESLMRRVEQLEQEDFQEEMNLTGSQVYDADQMLSDTAPAEINPDYKDINLLAEEFSTLRIHEPIEESSEPITSSEKLSLKDYYLKDFEDENENWEPNKKGEREAPSLSPTKWKLLFKVFLALLTIGIIGASLLYLWVSDQTGEEEIKASRGVADVSMALTYAQIKHIKPQNQNWSDPEFVKNNLTAVLASIYSSFACFDSHGQFDDCPYILRIYTNSDLSKFLVIAQPAPSVFQWIIPKAAIVVDSNAMEMRKIIDLRSLNRLLVNANTLDGVNALEISQLVRQGELIKLAQLEDKKNNGGFSPPKSLAYFHPGSENYIYNAPRYYQLGQTFLKRGLFLNEKTSNPHEIELFQQEMSVLSRFPDMILYYSEGLQGALKAQKALAALIPKEKFIVAYLQFNTLGRVLNSPLLIDGGANEIASLLQKDPHEMVQELAKDSKSIGEEIEAPIAEQDKNHPAYLELLDLKIRRQQALTSVSEQITHLLNVHNEEVQPSFNVLFDALIEQYLMINEEQGENIAQKLPEIYHTYSDIPLSQLMGYVSETGMAAVFQESLKEFQSVSLDKFTEKEFEHYLAKVEASTSWLDLYGTVNEISDQLKLENIPDPDQLISYQNLARSKVFQKLTEFLLMPEINAKTAFDSDGRENLTNILRTTWIYDLDANDFYLNEFDLRFQNQ